MNIRTAQFVKGVIGPDPVLEDGRPQIALVGRSNVGKSSTINALTRTRGLARKSATPGRTRELNLYLVNRSFYLVDLPGYGYSASSKGQTHRQEDLIGWYLFASPDPPAAVVFIIDGSVGATRADLETLDALERHGYEIVVAANKIDRIKPSVRARQLHALEESVRGHLLIPYSAEKQIGVSKLVDAILRYAEMRP